MSRSSSFLIACFTAELIGTFILVLIGDGSVAAFVLIKREVDILTTCFAFGAGAMIATFVAAKISGAHINPAASLAFALDGQLSWKLLPIYISAQYLGGFLAALLLWLNYSEAIGALDGGARIAFGGANSTGHIFATYPASWLNIWGSLFDQIMGTAILLFSLSAVTDKNNANLDTQHQPLIVALVICFVSIAFTPNCSAIFNPARDLSPRLLTYLFGYSSSVWSPLGGLYWILTGVLAPHVGAILGVFGYRLLIARRLEDISRSEELETAPISAIGQSSKQQPSAASKFANVSHQDQQQPAPNLALIN